MAKDTIAKMRRNLDQKWIICHYIHSNLYISLFVVDLCSLLNSKNGICTLTFLRFL